MKERIILGIDPGTNILGFGVIRIKTKGPEFVDMGVLRMQKEKDPYEKLRMIHEEVSRLCDLYKPDDLAVESPFYGRNVQVVLKLGRAQGSAILAAVMKGVPVFEYAPRKAKVAITGNGAASKEQVRMMIEGMLKIETGKLPLDASDALAIAMCHYYQLTNPLASTKTSTNWASFLSANPDRIINE